VKLKVTVSVLLISGSAFGFDGAVEVYKPGRAISRDAVIDAARGDSTSKKQLEAAIKHSEEIKDRASEVERRAIAELQMSDEQRLGEKAVNAANRVLKKCQSTMCNAMKSGQIAELAKSGDKAATQTISSALITVRSNEQMKLEDAVNKSLIDDGKNVQKVEKSCGTPIN
jgi:hypothetical protein